MQELFNIGDGGINGMATFDGSGNFDIRMMDADQPVSRIGSFVLRGSFFFEIFPWAVFYQWVYLCRLRLLSSRRDRMLWVNCDGTVF